MTIQAYDIWTHDYAAGEADNQPQLPAGWAGPEGPGIDVRMWPRSPRTGQPMLHCFTLWLPEEYRRRGADLVAVSVFQGDDERYFQDPLPDIAAVIAGQPADAVNPDHPFWAQLAQAQASAHTLIADDGVASLIAMMWLTEAQYAGPRTSRPAQAPELADGEADSASWRARHGLYGPLWLAARDDPNAGVPPVDLPAAGSAYADVPNQYDIFHAEHLGGTCMNPDGVRDGLTPWYIEVSRLGGISFGGDQDIALDLENTAFLGH